MWSVYDLTEMSEEVKLLCWINDRFEAEPESVKLARLDFAEIAVHLISRKESAWRSEAGRNYALAITHLEDACIRTIKWLYTESVVGS